MQISCRSLGVVDAPHADVSIALGFLTELSLSEHVDHLSCEAGATRSHRIQKMDLNEEPNLRKTEKI